MFPSERPGGEGGGDVSWSGMVADGAKLVCGEAGFTRSHAPDPAGWV